MVFWSFDLTLYEGGKGDAIVIIFFFAFLLDMC